MKEIRLHSIKCQCPARENQKIIPVSKYHEVTANLFKRCLSAMN